MDRESRNSIGLAVAVLFGYCCAIGCGQLGAQTPHQQSRARIVLTRTVESAPNSVLTAQTPVAKGEIPSHSFDRPNPASRTTIQPPPAMTPQEIDQWQRRADRLPASLPGPNRRMASPSAQRVRTVSYQQPVEPIPEPTAEGDGLGGPAESSLSTQDDVTPLPAAESSLPSPVKTFEVLPSSLGTGGSLEITGEADRISIIARDAPLADVLAVMAERYGINFVHGAMAERVSIALRDVPLEDALTSLLGVAGYAWTTQRGIVLVSSISENQNQMVAPEMSGRIVRVFPLDYVSAEEINAVITGMLSPTGKSYVLQSDPNDNRKTTDQIVVEDLPGSVARVEQYLRQVDVPPRQVVIEARVLEVKLRESERHGINFSYLNQISGHRLTIGTTGSGLGTSEGAFFAQLDGADLTGLVDALKTRVNAKTLASPRIQVINGQQARLQVGQQLGFRVLTTTQTSTLEQVRFLDVGVVLTITPRIARDGRVMLSVKPEVSTGQINPDTGLPEEETSEVETNVMLGNGKGMVIGGLIQEKTNATRSQVPKFGDVPLLGKLFRNRDDDVRRSEIIFVLVPRVVSPYMDDRGVDLNVAQMDCRDQLDVMRTETRLMDQCLTPTARPYDRQQIIYDRMVAGQHPMRDFPSECLGTPDCGCSACRPSRAIYQGVALPSQPNVASRLYAPPAPSTTPIDAPQSPAPYTAIDRAVRPAPLRANSDVSTQPHESPLTSTSAQRFHGLAEDHRFQRTEARSQRRR